jgi:anti-sigma28 factor (negative regulator of flagellin synthesis)
MKRRKNMVNEIKMDKISAYGVENPLEPKTKQEVSAQGVSEGVVISQQLNELVKLISTYEEPINQNRVNDLKYQIKHNDYIVNFDSLSHKLLSTGLLTMIGD